MSSTVDIEFDSIDEDRETKHAWYINFEEGFDGVSCYIPKAEVEVDEKRKVVTMPAWMAESKGLDIYASDGPDEGDQFSIF